MKIKMYAIVDDDYNTIKDVTLSVSSEKEIKGLAEEYFTKEEIAKYQICYDIIGGNQCCPIFNEDESDNDLLEIENRICMLEAELFYEKLDEDEKEEIETELKTLRKRKNEKDQ